jgi:hypothetical protein
MERTPQSTYPNNHQLDKNKKTRYNKNQHNKTPKTKKLTAEKTTDKVQFMK